MKRLGPFLIVLGGLGIAYFIYRHFKASTAADDKRVEERGAVGNAAAADCAAKGGTWSGIPASDLSTIEVGNCTLPEATSAHVAVNYGGCPDLRSCKGYDPRTGVSNPAPQPPPAAPTGVTAIPGRVIDPQKSTFLIPGRSLQ